MFVTVAPNTTWCPDTPENWREFERLKAALMGGRSVSRPRDSVEFNLELQKRISSENKKLRGLSRYLPGHEPDRKWI